MYITAIGQDSHAFVAPGQEKKLVLGGVVIPDCPGLAGNSDADVVLHALTNAVSGVSGKNILGRISDEMCRAGCIDSACYLREAIKTLPPGKIVHVSFTVEAKRPRLAAHIMTIRTHIAGLLSIPLDHVGFTATSGEGLTSFGRGEGIMVFVLITFFRET